MLCRWDDSAVDDPFLERRASYLYMMRLDKLYSVCYFEVLPQPQAQQCCSGCWVEVEHSPHGEGGGDPQRPRSRPEYAPIFGATGRVGLAAEMCGGGAAVWANGCAVLWRLSNCVVG